MSCHQYPHSLSAFTTYRPPLGVHSLRSSSRPSRVAFIRHFHAPLRLSRIPYPLGTMRPPYHLHQLCAAPLFTGSNRHTSHNTCSYTYSCVVYRIEEDGPCWFC